MRFAKQLSAATTLMAATAGVWAHDGHGLAGSHWHSTDAAGIALVAVLAGLALFFSRGE
ncbi:hypothetical protein [Ramlibacter sp. WS9]|uniref:hypothetical protein n=1 Tax=Ramlibacter sp. WS9 TaxID=1882741 RepID=UPI0013053332|nr:hypothetical protein [Ramlibacter sp. WS9]